MKCLDVALQSFAACDLHDNCTLSRGGLDLYTHVAWTQPLRLLAALYSCMQNRKPTLLIANKDSNNNHKASWAVRYSKVVMQISWRALWLWRCPARCYTSLSGSWSGSGQLSPHHPVCINQQRCFFEDCYSIVRIATGFFSPLRYTWNLCS